MSNIVSNAANSPCLMVHLIEILYLDFTFFRTSLCESKGVSQKLSSIMSQYSLSDILNFLIKSVQ